MDDEELAGASSTPIGLPVRHGVDDDSWVEMNQSLATRDASWLTRASPTMAGNRRAMGGSLAIF